MSLASDISKPQEACCKPRKPLLDRGWNGWSIATARLAGLMPPTSPAWLRSPKLLADAAVQTDCQHPHCSTEVADHEPHKCGPPGRFMQPPGRPLLALCCPKTYLTLLLWLMQIRGRDQPCDTARGRPAQGDDGKKTRRPQVRRLAGAAEVAAASTAGVQGPPPPPPAEPPASPNRPGGGLSAHPLDDLLGDRQRVGVRQLRGQTREGAGAVLPILLVLGLPQPPQDLRCRRQVV